MSTSDYESRDPNQLPPAPPEPGGYPAYASGGGGQPAGPMPKEVNWATILVVVGIVLSLISVIVLVADKHGFIHHLRDTHPSYSGKKRHDVYKASVIGAVIGFVIFAALYLWLVMKIRQGRNWARITITVLLVLGILFGLLGLGGNSLGVTKAFGVIGLILNIAIVVLLWLRPSNEYFKPRAA